VHVLVPDVLSEGRAKRVRIVASVRAVPQGYEAEVRLSDGDAGLRRVLVGVDCEEVSDAVALVVAVHLDPVRTASEVRARQVTEGPPMLANEPRPDPAPSPPPIEFDPSVDLPETAFAARRSGERPPVRAGLAIIGGAAYGPTNAAYGDLGATLAVFGGRWRAELAGAWSLPRELRGSGGNGGRFDGWRLAARGCFVPRVGARERLELPLCPGFELGQVRGRGLPDLPVVLDASFPWIALALGQGLWFAPLDRLAVGGGLQLAVPLGGGRFLIESEEIQRIPALSVRGFVGIEVRLP
jgi:hypothetical protein